MLKYEASWIILNNSVKFIIVGKKNNNYYSYSQKD